jgi:hypothetical protein
LHRHFIGRVQQAGAVPPARSASKASARQGKRGSRALELQRGHLRQVQRATPEAMRSG